MKPVQTTIALAIGGAMISFSALAQTTQGMNPAAQTAPAATETSPARTADRDARNTNTSLAQEDQTFLENAIQGSYAEIEGSQLALEKTQSADVRQFAERMIKDHGEMVKKATKLATEKGLTPPDGPSAMQVTEVTALKALTGGAFDAMYVNRIGVAAHESTVEMFEEATREVQDADIKAMANEALPKLREHLKMARDLNQKQEKQ